MKQLITIIIPIFNNADTLHPTINSILNQTYKNFEIIFIDDASTDSSLKILEKYNSQNSKIKILSTNRRRIFLCQKSCTKISPRKIHIILQIRKYNEC